MSSKGCTIHIHELSRLCHITVVWVSNQEVTRHQDAPCYCIYDYVTIQFLDETVVATLFVDEKRENQFSLRSVMSGNQLVPSSYPKVADTQDRAKVL
jgi:hypothetical protein